MSVSSQFDVVVIEFGDAHHRHQVGDQRAVVNAAVAAAQSMAIDIAIENAAGREPGGVDGWRHDAQNGGSSMMWQSPLSIMLCSDIPS